MKKTLRQKWFPTFDDCPEMIPFVARWARTVAVGAALGYGGYQLVGNNIDYTRGERTGVINKFSENLIFGTHNGEMALEGIVSGDQKVGANVWNFSLDMHTKHGENKEELMSKVKKYLDSGERVKVTYVRPVTTWPWRSGTNYLVTDIEPAGKKN